MFSYDSIVENLNNYIRLNAQAIYNHCLHNKGKDWLYGQLQMYDPQYDGLDFFLCITGVVSGGKLLNRKKESYHW